MLHLHPRPLTSLTSAFTHTHFRLFSALSTPPAPPNGESVNSTSSSSAYTSTSSSSSSASSSAVYNPTIPFASSFNRRTRASAKAALFYHTPSRRISLRHSSVFIDESIRNTTSNMVTKAEQEKHPCTQQVDFAQIKSELQLMEKNDLAMIKAENDRLAGVRLDLNLEKGRLREETSGQDQKMEVEYKIEQEIAVLRTAIQASKATTLQYLVGIVTGGAALLMAYLRFRS
ncbi:DUF1640-domain-containing protein [Dendrothele bispora CBS 962.96]|uniref:DUF1640-domain-containing protein n=1 Tax=Dendrothele bispora (strain CBS 962.96) TaxID=1314807 RepID=A0A4S8MEI5_DENBC|nr:DUF1640-domain-containing protein [Dendrothele bispora CBS 962.96]